MKKRGLLHFAVVLIICLTTSYAIVYTSIQFFPKSDLGGNFDAARYLAMYRKEKVDICWFRPLTPFLARNLPNLPKRFFESSRSITDSWIATIKFGMVNFFFLLLTGVVFFYFLSAIGFSVFESLIGILLFYTARPVIQSAGVPMVDAAGYFFLLLCLYAIQRQNILILIIGFYIGIFAKETVFLAFPAILLSQLNPKYKSEALCLLIPGVIIYYTLCFFYDITPKGLSFNIQFMNLISMVRYQLFSLFHFNKMLDLFSSFGLLWILAILPLVKGELPPLLQRWSWLIIIMLCGIFLFDLNLGRVLFTVFPIVIPLAIYGIRYFIKENETAR